jgi:hypothetical protein
MTRTRIGIAAVLMGTGMLGALPAAGWRDPYALPLRAPCDLGRGFATGSLLQPARPRKVADGDMEIAGAMQGTNGSPFTAMRHGNLGAGAVIRPLEDLTGPGISTNPNRGSAPER